MAGTAPDRLEAEKMLRALHEHRQGRLRADDLSPMIHPDAEMRLMIAFGALLRGRETIVRALRSARRDTTVYYATIRRFEWLDDRTVLTFGRGRYALEGGGYAESRLYWLDEFEDGLIRRAHVFMREDSARRAYEERFEERTNRP
jgi:hypothetical protein